MRRPAYEAKIAAMRAEVLIETHKTFQEIISTIGTVQQSQKLAEEFLFQQATRTQARLHQLRLWALALSTLIVLLLLSVIYLAVSQ